MKRLFQRFWDSPTANTWASLFTRSVSLLLVLPLVLRHFSSEEAAVWFVFSSVLAVQGILGFGFSPSFARLLAYARAGAAVEAMADLRGGQAVARGKPDQHSVDRLTGCMSRVFRWLMLASLVLMGTLGTMVVWRPIAATGHSPGVWLGWGVIVVGSSLAFWGSFYVSWLQGMNHLAAWRRWETVLGLGSIVTAFIVLLAGGRVLALALNYQGWSVVGLLVNRRLCLRSGEARFSERSWDWDPAVFAVVWQSAWKNGITNVLTYGLVQSTGVIYAQYAAPAETATYNFALRIFTVLGQVVQAPFLSKLPELARLRALGELGHQRQLVRRGMRLTHWGTVVCVAGGFVALPHLLAWVGSRSVTFDPLLWTLFGLNLFVERHGGMLHQVRNLTNQPMEHWGMVGAFVGNITLIALLRRQGMYAFPLAMLGTQVLFSLWFAARIAYPALGVRPGRFEATVSVPPFACLLAICAGGLWST